MTYPQTALVELELNLDHRYITPTPFGLRTSIPVTSVTTTPSGSGPTPTPRVPIYGKTGLDVYQRMGASLFCSPAKFDGCDTAANPQDAKIIGLSGATWSWIISPKSGVYGIQAFRAQLWTVVRVENGPEQTNPAWEYTFQIEALQANPIDSILAAIRGDLSAVIIAAIDAIALIAAAVLGLRSRSATSMNRPGTGVADALDARGTAKSGKMPTAFISYRRSGSWSVAQRVHDALMAVADARASFAAKRPRWPSAPFVSPADKGSWFDGKGRPPKRPGTSSKRRRSMLGRGSAQAGASPARLALSAA